MALYTTLAALSQTAGSNPPDGATDAPSTIDDQLRLLGSFDALMRDEAHIYASAVSGTNIITATIPTNPTSYVVGRSYRFVAAGANTGAVTLNFNSIGAKSLLKVGNVALTGGELVASAVYEVVYDGVNFQLVGMYGFKSSIGSTAGSSGYQYLPSGLLVQWGTINASSGGTSTSFPTTFSTFFVANLTHGGTLPGTPGAMGYTATTSAITAYCANAGGPYLATYIAIGK